MPEEGISFVRKESLLSYEEILRIMRPPSPLERINKNKNYWWENPSYGKTLMTLLRLLSEVDGLDKIAITTNGTTILRHLEELLQLGIRTFNLSLDTIDAARFQQITRRDSFDEVWNCYKEMLEADVDLKINSVVMKGQNVEDILPMVALTETDNIAVRFIEEMPFNGSGLHEGKLEWDHVKILEHITGSFQEIIKLPDPKSSTSFNYQVKGHKGTFGIIPAYTRSFCGSCNRLRITPTGMIKTCLYDDGVFNIRDIMRAGATDDELLFAVEEAIGHRAVDGHEAEAKRSIRNTVSESMATIGG